MQLSVAVKRYVIETSRDYAPIFAKKQTFRFSREKREHKPLLMGKPADFRNPEKSDPFPPPPSPLQRV